MYTLSAIGWVVLAIFVYWILCPMVYFLSFGSIEILPKGKLWVLLSLSFVYWTAIIEYVFVGGWSLF